MNKRGFTLVELMVTIIILSMFILSVGMMLVSSWKFWNSGWAQVGVQQNASYAFARIEKIIHSGDSAIVLGGGSGLQVTEDAATSTFQLNGNVLQLITNGNTENVASGVQAINFAIAGNTVSITLTLVDGNARTDFRTTVLWRNTL